MNDLFKFKIFIHFCRKKTNNLKLYSTTTLIIKYIPQRYDHNEEIICKAINHAFPSNESIELRYKLDIHCRFKSLNFTC